MRIAATLRISEIFVRRRPGLASILLSAMTVTVGCSKGDESSSAAPPATTAAATAAASDSAGPSSGVTAVRGQIVTATDSIITVASPRGDVSVKIVPPLEVYTRVPAQLSQVKPNSFVGVTSVPQPDGSLRATEIHIFPEKLRGTNEGSFMMGQRGGGGGPGGGGGGGANRGAGDRMTNGTVTGSPATGGGGGGGGGAGNRMTNGTVSGQSAGTLTVRFQTDSQKIVVPAGVTVTEMTLTQTKLTPGTPVTIRATKQPDGTLTASMVILGGGRRPRT